MGKYVKKKATAKTTKPVIKKASKADVDQLLDELSKPHRPNLDGKSEVVKARFDDVDLIAENNDDYIMLLDGMEEALIGTADVNGTVVAVYERNLCIKCIAKGYGKKWYENLGYSEEEIRDKEYMAVELYRTATEDFEFNTLGSLPYQHEHAPLIITGFDIDEARWDKFRKA